MRSIKDIIAESHQDELDKLVKAPEKKKIKNAIYDQLDKTKVTGHYYRDEHWQGVTDVKNDITTALSTIKNANHEYEVIIAPENGGYRQSKDGMTQWKEYNISIYIKGAELPFMKGVLNCHACGSVKDPFDTYDMSCILF